MSIAPLASEIADTMNELIVAGLSYDEQSMVTVDEDGNPVFVNQTEGGNYMCYTSTRSCCQKTCYDYWCSMYSVFDGMADDCDT